jgi:hypothetical protein
LIVAYAVAGLAVAAVPIMTIGVLPDSGPDPAAAQQCVAQMVELMN